MIASARVMSRRSQRGSVISRNPSITIWPASVPVIGRVLPGGEERQRKHGARGSNAEQWRQQPVGILNLRYRGVSGAMERRCRENENRRVDKDGK